MIAAFKKGKWTTLCHIVIEQVYKDRGVTMVKNLNSYDFAESYTDNILKFFDKTGFEALDDSELIIRGKGLYAIFDAIVEIGDTMQEDNQKE